MFVNGSIGGVNTTFLVDTGSNITIVTPEVFNRIPESVRPALDTVITEMVLADGRSLPFKGKAILTLRLGRTVVEHEIWIADIGLEGILGMDYLQKMNCELISEQGEYRLTLPEGSVKCGQSSNGSVCCRVAVAETVTVPPGTEMLVPGMYVEPTGVTGPGVLEVAAKFLERSQLLVAKSLVNMEQAQVPLRLLNPTTEPRTVYKNTTVAWCEPVEAPTEQPTVAACQLGSGNPVLSQVPEFLLELLDRSSEHLNSNQREDVAALLTEFADVFAASADDLGRTGVVKHRINTGNASPIKQAARRLPMHQKLEAEREVKKMLDRGVIEPSSSPWCSPIVLVKKKDGSTRFCVDFRRVNQVTSKDAFPLPRIQDALESLSGSRWFSTLDLQSGYWQVEMEEEDKPKTAFTTGSGLYQFVVMPFGLANAPASFERLMERVLAGLTPELCLVYLDDLIIHAKNFEEELKRLRKVFERLRAAGLKLNSKKCHLFQKRVCYLGHIVSEDGVETDPAKIKAIIEWPTPRTVTHVRSFLGLCSYYRRFICGFADIAKPLYKLTEQTKRPFHWKEESEAAFCRLKEVLTTAPVLAYPTCTDPFILDTDASDKGLGTVLSQLQDGEERVLAYYSRVLSKPERRYCVTRKELLAVVEGVRHFHHYLYGRRFLVRSDHGALQWLLNFKNPEGQLARWIELLDTYDFTIQHRPGHKHTNADALSRRPCRDCKHCERLEKKELCKEPEPGECRCPPSVEPERIQAAIEPVTLPEDDNTQQQARAVQTRRGAAAAAVAATAIGEVEHTEADRSEEQTDELDPETLHWSSQFLRDKQLEDEDLRLMILWKEKGSERPGWADISTRSPGLMCYWA